MNQYSSSEISSHMKDVQLNIKSEPVYDRWWQLYEGFCESRGIDFVVYTSFNDFVGCLSHGYKYSSIWQAISGVNKYLKIRYDSDDFLQE